MPWTFLQIYKDGLPEPTSALAMHYQVQRWRSRNLWQEFYSAIHCISCVARWNKIVATNCDSSIFPLVQTERWSPQESDRQTHVFIIASILCTGMGPMWNWRRKFELIYNCGKYFGFTSTYKKYFPVTLSSKSQPSRNRLHEPFFSLSHSVVIDGLLRGLRMPGDGPCRGVSPWELSRDNHTTTSTTSCQLVLIKQNQFFSFLFYVWNHPCSVQNWNLFHRQSSKELPSYFAGWPWKEPLLRNIWHKSQLGYFNCARHSFN